MCDAPGYNHDCTTEQQRSAMTPNIMTSPTGVLFEDEKDVDTRLNDSKASGGTDSGSGARRMQFVWRNIILFSYLHLAALYGVYLAFTSAKILTSLWALFLYYCGGLGITAGAHRLWSHKAYKAKWPLRLLLVFFNSIAFQDAVVDWARDHRVHHKYSETDADPHNAKRGFFFSHVGWLLVRKHPDVKTRGRGIDLSDLYADPILRFQKRWYLVLMPLSCFVMPAVVPWLCWGESLHNAWFVASLMRYCFNLNVTWLVNSAAHIWGHKPYDRHINPAENKSVAIMTLGEGWHNYHHTFPWDYKTAELGHYSTNFTTAFIDFFARIGWAYDLKTVSSDVVRQRVQRTGDGSHERWGADDANDADGRDDEAKLHAH